MPGRGGVLYRLNNRPRLASPQARGLRAHLFRLGWASALVVLSIGIRLAVQHFVSGGTPIVVPLVAIAACAAFGGLLVGLGGTFLATLLFGYFHLGATRAGQNGFSFTPEVQLFALEGLLISGFGAWLFAVRRHARAADDANAALEKQMLDIGDQERRRLGHDLHDGLGQQLTGIALLSETLAHRLQAQTSPFEAQAEQITGLVNEAIVATRELARGLSPLTLESDGLLAAIEELATRTTKLFHLNCQLECTLREWPLSDDRAIHVYRIVQEAISNSFKHGKAKNVTIRIVAATESDASLFSDEKGVVNITVLDDGSGLSAKTVEQPGIGVQIMQYRANLIGARLSIARYSAEGGTIVSFLLSGGSDYPLHRNG